MHKITDLTQAPTKNQLNQKKETENQIKEKKKDKKCAIKQEADILIK